MDSLFGAVCPLEFKAQLRAHLDKPQHREDPVWYAVRNTVYASGCRLHRSANHAANFSAIQDEAWGYFSNALSVHSELLLSSPSIGAVRALLAMVNSLAFELPPVLTFAIQSFFAEGLGSPALGSGLIANAALLAQALGLNKKSCSLGTTSDYTTSKDSWLFWAVYCCEKIISRRINRSSVSDLPPCELYRLIRALVDKT